MPGILTRPTPRHGRAVHVRGHRRDVLVAGRQPLRCARQPHPERTRMELSLQSQRVGANWLHGHRKRRILRERRLLPGTPPFGTMALACAESEAAWYAGVGRRTARMRVCALPYADGPWRRCRVVAEKGNGRNERPIRLRRRDVGSAAELVLRMEWLGYAHETAHGVDGRRSASWHPQTARFNRRTGKGRKPRAYDQTFLHS